MMITVTATSMKLKFPEFANIEDATIEFAIEEAALAVGNNWAYGSSVGIMYLAAHLIAAGKAAAAVLAGGSGGEIASESIGRMSISYKTTNVSLTNSGATPDDYTSSSYGRRYLELYDMNFGAPVVVV